MLWLEMSRDEEHGGGEWAFSRALWSPTRKANGGSWPFWSTVARVRRGDGIVHLRGKAGRAAFVGLSTAAEDAVETSERPPAPGQWAYAERFNRVRLEDFTPFDTPVLLSAVFELHAQPLRSYFDRNRASTAKKRLFYVRQAGRLQCLNGAYLSEVDSELARLLLPQAALTGSGSSRLELSVRTREQIAQALVRVGQREFAEAVRTAYGCQCCFPECEVRDRTFLRGAHIARWADAPELRGNVENGLCLCLMHDAAFERGMFTIDFEGRIWTNESAILEGSWGQKHIAPFQGRCLRIGAVRPSPDAIIQHWERVRCYPL